MCYTYLLDRVSEKSRDTSVYSENLNRLSINIIPPPNLLYNFYGLYMNDDNFSSDFETGVKGDNLMFTIVTPILRHIIEKLYSQE